MDEGNALLPARLDTPCVHWSGSRSPENYGRLEAHLYAHRVAWEEATGEPIPEGLEVDHLCHNLAAARGECAGGSDCPHRLCVNTDHLEVVSRATNILRGVSPWAVNARKTHCVRGHEFTEANTAWRRGVRECIECRREQKQRVNDRITAQRTHCPQGHEYAPETTKWIKGKAGSLTRRCMLCVEERPTCSHGHPWDEKNTAYLPGGGRRCRACHREAERRRRG